MTISSRTPEGSPNHCPVCGALVCIEPSQPPGDAPCPRCGILLWFIRTAAGLQLYESEVVGPLRKRIAEIICENLGLSRHQVSRSTSFKDIGVDSLDIVELIMELEEEFDVTIPDDAAEKIKTIGDAVDQIIQNHSQ